MLHRPLAGEGAFPSCLIPWASWSACLLCLNCRNPVFIFCICFHVLALCCSEFCFSWLIVMRSAEDGCSWVCDSRRICHRHETNHQQLLLVQSTRQFSSQNGTKITGALPFDWCVSGIIFAVTMMSKMDFIWLIHIRLFAFCVSIVILSCYL